MSVWLVETLVATTLLMALVLLARPLVRRAFGAPAAYALWLVPLIRVALPPIQGAPEPVAALAGPSVEIAFAAAGSTGGVGAWLLGVWATGAVIFAVWHVAAYRRFLARAVVKSARGPGGRVEIAYTDAVSGPAAVGLLRRRILLPVDFSARFETAESVLALRHEEVHHARGDLWANAAALAMLSLHWFNPIAYRAYRAFREDQELSCDAAVIAAASLDERAAYGAALVKSARGIQWATPAAPSTICSMTRTHNLKRRLKMVRMHRKSALASAGGALTLGVTALAGLTLTATSGIAAEPVGAIKAIAVKEVIGAKGVADPGIKTERIVIERVAGKDGAEAAIAKFTKGKCGTTPMTTFKVGDANDGSGKPTETRFIMCNKDGAPVGDRLAALEKARVRIATSDGVDAENRAKVLRALDSAIAKMKAAN